MHLRNLSIARRAGIGFALIAALVALLGWFGLVQMSAIRSSEVTIENQWLPSMRLVNDIRDLMLRTRTISLRLAVDPNPQHIVQYRNQMDTRGKELVGKIEQLDALKNLWSPPFLQY